MAGIIAGGKYRIAEKLYSQDGYEAYKAIDIENREHQEVLVNRYSGDKVRLLLPKLYELKNHSECAFLAMTTESGTVDVIFAYPPGNEICSMYKKHNGPDRDVAYVLFENYLHRLLLMSALPMIFMSTASLPENIYVLENDRKTFTNMMVHPDICDDFQFILKNISRCAELLLKKRLYNFSFELAFLDALKEGSYNSVTEIYSHWRSVCTEKEIEEPNVAEKKAFLRLTFFISQRKKRAQQSLEKKTYKDSSASANI